MHIIAILGELSLLLMILYSIVNNGEDMRSLKMLQFKIFKTQISFLSEMVAFVKVSSRADHLLES